MTNEELIVGGAALATIVVFSLAFYILTVIAGWKILTKAGEAGWKILIPIYNYYILYKIAGVNFWIWLFLPAIASGIVSSFAQGDSVSTVVAILLVVICIYSIVGACKFANGLAKSFGKGTGFAVGLFFLPNIFQLILGFGSAKYVKQK